MPQQVTSSPFYAAQPIPNGGGGAPGGFGLGAGSGSGSGSQDPSHVAPGYAGGGGGFGGGLGGGLGANHNINANAPPMGTSFPRHGSFHGSSPMAGPSRWAGSGDPAGVMSGLSILKSRRDRRERESASVTSRARSRVQVPEVSGLYHFPLTRTHPPLFPRSHIGSSAAPHPSHLTAHCPLTAPCDVAPCRLVYFCFPASRSHHHSRCVCVCIFVCVCVPCY
jgi:hypothetical protein